MCYIVISSTGTQYFCTRCKMLSPVPFWEVSLCVIVALWAHSFSFPLSVVTPTSALGNGTLVSTLLLTLFVRFLLSQPSSRVVVCIARPEATWNQSHSRGRCLHCWWKLQYQMVNGQSWCSIWSSCCCLEMFCILMVRVAQSTLVVATAMEMPTVTWSKWARCWRMTAKQRYTVTINGCVSNIGAFDQFWHRRLLGGLLQPGATLWLEATNDTCYSMADIGCLKQLWAYFHPSSQNC